MSNFAFANDLYSFNPFLSRARILLPTSLKRVKRHLIQTKQPAIQNLRCQHDVSQKVIDEISTTVVSSTYAAGVELSLASGAQRN